MADEFNDMQKLVGPKRVDTKEVEIEAHDPMKIQKLLERRSTKPVLFSDFSFTKVEPKDDCSCNEDR